MMMIVLPGFECRRFESGISIIHGISVLRGWRIKKSKLEALFFSVKISYREKNSDRSFNPKILKNKMSKSVSGYFKTKKSSFVHKAWGKVLVGSPLNKELFLRLPRGFHTTRLNKHGRAVLVPSDASVRYYLVGRVPYPGVYDNLIDAK